MDQTQQPKTEEARAVDTVKAMIAKVASEKQTQSPAGDTGANPVDIKVEHTQPTPSSDEKNASSDLHAQIDQLKRENTQLKMGGQTQAGQAAPVQVSEKEKKLQASKALFKGTGLDPFKGAGAGALK